MYQPVYLNRFEKDLKRMQKRGKDMDKFKMVFLKLLAGKILETRYCDHSLIGNFANRRECHNKIRRRKRRCIKLNLFAD